MGCFIGFSFLYAMILCKFPTKNHDYNLDCRQQKFKFQFFMKNISINEHINITNFVIPRENNLKKKYTPKM